MNFLNKKASGFILIEKIIYICLVCIILTIFTAFTVSVTRNATMVVNAEEVRQNSRFILSRITQEIKTSKQITSIEPERIFFIDSDGNSVCFYWDAGNKAVIYNDGVEDILISNDSVLVTRLAFDSSGEIIKIELDLEINQLSGYPTKPYQFQISSLVVPRAALY